MGAKRKGGADTCVHSGVEYAGACPLLFFSLFARISFPISFGEPGGADQAYHLLPSTCHSPPPQFAIASKKGGRRTWGPIENNSLPTWKRPSPAPFNYRAASARLHLLFSGQESWHSSLRSSSLCARMAPVALSPSQFIRFFPISFVCLPSLYLYPSGEEHLRYAYIIIEGEAHPELSCPVGKKERSRKTKNGRCR